MNKICIKCNKILELNCFYFRNDIKKYRNCCKNCDKLYKKEYYEKNREKISKKNKKHQSSIKYKKNKNLRRRNRRYNNPVVRLRDYIGAEINNILKKNGSNKKGRSFLNAINYSLEELKNHIESKFESWMAWNNQGIYDPKNWDDNDPTTWKWQLDHIIPHSTFNYDSMDHPDFYKCWDLSNLRPYSAKQNILDGNRR